MKNASDTEPNVGRVTILPIEEENVSIIANPNENKEKPRWGKVIRVGKRKADAIPYAEEGDTVAYGKYAGITLEFLDGPHVTLFESELINKY